MGRSRQRKPKKVEVDIDREDINKADLKVSKKGRKDYDAGSKMSDERGDNDPSWYAHNAQLLKDTASFPFSLPLGTKIDWNPSTSLSGVEFTHYNQSVAGIAVLEFMPTIGPASGSSADPVNVAANSLYTFVRRNVSTYTQYDAPDMMMYLLAMDSAYSVYAMCARAYGLMQAYYVYNRYYARPMVNALGFSFDTLINNLADFRAMINAYAFKLAQFCVPSEVDYFKRHLWMNMNLFYDSATVKAQTYAYKQVGFYQFAEQTDGPAKLLWKQISNYVNSATGLLDLNGIQNIMNDAILPIMESQDCIAMAGDILRAFGSDKLFVVPPIAEGYLTAPIMSYEVLSQFENATLVGQPITATLSEVEYSPNITQRVELDFGGVGLQQNLAFDSGNSGSATYSLYAGNMLKENLMLNMHKNDPTPEDVIVATRLSNIPNVVAQNGSTPPVGVAVYKTIASEAALRLIFTQFTTVSGKWQPQVVGVACSALTLASTTDPGYAASIASIWSQFDWCPTIKFGRVASTNDGVIITQLQDSDNYTLLAEKDLIQLTETAMLSLFSTEGILSMASKPVN